MVACNVSFRDAATMVRYSRSTPELIERFRVFADLLQLQSPAAVKLFGKACGIKVSCVEVEALQDPAHPLHFLAKDLPET